MNYTLAIVDDHPLFREGFRYTLEISGSQYKFLEFSDGKEIIKHIEKDQLIDLIFMDILMPDTDGITATMFIKKQFPDIKIIAISSSESLEFIENMIKAGVNGYILKDTSLKDLVTATETVLKGESYFSPRVIIKLSKQIVSGVSTHYTGIPAELSEREVQLLKVFCAGLSRKEISNRFFISERTVDKHKENILKKTHCKNVMELIFYSLKHGLIDINLMDQMAS
ncbi:response regulator [Carboxylicivirga caseinilyticus]|uniref:response regulator n=1 Tax=Carboxylicivirga caseinilyticus TaxID=3417572 RepID=UPI003D341E34|nr:response regulator transcription factor [Marinilabiliaceae bacterium A049]